MKLLLVGVFSNRWSTNIEMTEALLSAGHDVDIFDYRSEAFKMSSINPGGNFAIIVSKITNFLRILNVPLLKGLHYVILGRAAMSNKLLNTVLAGSYDLIIFSKTDTVPPDLIKKISCLSKTWYFFMDSLDHGKKIGVINYAKAADFVSATFSDVVDYFRSGTGKKGIFLQNQGVDLSKFRFLDIKNKKFDVVFVGVKDDYRFSIISKLRKANIKVSCYGDGWENPPIYNEELVYLYNNSKIVLNFCRGGNGFSVRVFQVMACSAFVLSDYCSDFNLYFKKCCHLDWVENDWVDKVKYYLERPEIVNKISQAAYDLIIRKYSWDAVMANITTKLRCE